VLFQGDRTPGTYKIEWDGKTSGGTRAASGIYFCRMRAGGYEAVIKLSLIR
jgi:hypothetical protein